MALKYQPDPGSIVICDFTGFIIPEMVKKRRVVIIKKHSHSVRLVFVVPLSTTAPFKEKRHHLRLSEKFSSDELFCTKPVWVKCDMVYTVSIDRLTLQKDKNGYRKVVSVSIDVLNEIRHRVFAYIK